VNNLKLRKILHYGSLLVIWVMGGDYCIWSVGPRDAYHQVEISS